MVPGVDRGRVGQWRLLKVAAPPLAVVLAVQVAAAQPAAPQPAAPAANPDAPAPARPALARPVPARPVPDETRVDLTSAASPAEPPPDEAGVDLTGVAPLGPPPLTPAEEEEEPPYRHGGQRNLGFGPRIGLFSGFGAGARAGSAYVGTDISGGWRPLMANLDAPFNETELEMWHAWQLNGQVYVSFNPYSRLASGLTAGYLYNSISRHGVSLAYDAVLNLSALLGIQLNAGFTYFPNARESLRDHADIPDDTRISDSGFGILTGLGLGLMIYP